MLAEVATCISLIKGVNDAISAAKEAGGNASAFANIIGNFAKANDKVLETEQKYVGRLSVQDSMQIQIAKRQLSTFNQQLKDIMLMQGLSGDYNEIMNRVEESRLEHEKRLRILKLKKQKRDEELKLVLQVLLYAACGVSVVVMIAWMYNLFTQNIIESLESQMPRKKSPAKKKKKSKSRVNEAGNYTKPTMRKRLFNKIKAGSKGGNPGQWSARKAQMLAKQYKDAGGGYK